MLFNSLPFLGFIAVVFLIYPWLNHRRQNIFLLVASYFFYGYWDWRFTFLLLGNTIVNFWVGDRIYASTSLKQKKLYLSISIAVNLGILGFFKYFNFFINSADNLLQALGLNPHISVLHIILPVGISFYTFQAMSYVIDIYRGTLKPTESFVDFALFKAFFPQLVAGPIERARNLLPQISKPRQIMLQNILTGLNLVLLGYFKKVAIADTLAPIVENIFASPGTMSGGQLWTGVYAFTFQIYGDFSGYTDIARGIARILGFELILNFNAPYLSRNIAEFWRRWHISLSSWLRDYLYISMGGNRRGKARTYANLMITMFLGGLWHGAAWTFVIWGLLHGIYLACHRIIIGDRKLDLSWSRAVPGWIVDIIKIFFTFHIVALTWVFFRAPDLPSALTYLGGLFRFQFPTGLSGPVLFAGTLIVALDVAQTWTGSHTWLAELSNARPLRYTVAQCMLVCVLAAAVAHVQVIVPFIYFQF